VLNDCFPGGAPIARIIDFVGYGGGPINALPNNCESLAAATPASAHQCAVGFGSRSSNTLNVLAADFRKSNGMGDGCQDTDNNLADFTQRPAAPRNSASAPAFCVSPPTFVGTPGRANCHGGSVAALAQRFNGLNKAASALGYPTVSALQDAIRAYCRA
jgi:hypothetical protein